MRFCRKRLELQTRQAIWEATERAEQDLLASKQQKGLDVVSRLVQTGRYEDSDLMDAMRKLFPSEGTEELQGMLEKVRKDLALKTASRLVQRLHVNYVCWGLNS
jgi:transposase